MINDKNTSITDIILVSKVCTKSILTGVKALGVFLSTRRYRHEYNETTNNKRFEANFPTILGVSLLLSMT